MTRKKLIEEIKLNPSRYYRMPSDVNRDRRFRDEERLEILAAWERDARAMSGDDESTPETERLRQLEDARMELERRMPGVEHRPHLKLGSAEHR
jgi:hypothetical protein